MQNNFKKRQMYNYTSNIKQLLHNSKINLKNLLHDKVDINMFDKTDNFCKVQHKFRLIK